MTETWVDVKGYEGLYKVSNFGNVRSMDREVPCKRYGIQNKKGKILDLKPKANGYVYATLVKNGEIKHYRVHRLVAMHFLSNSNKPTVNHKDGNKSNNIVTNLEWCTDSENCRHKVDVLGKQVGANSTSAKMVLHSITGIFYDTLKEACNAFGANYKATSAALCGRGKTDFVYV